MLRTGDGLSALLIFVFLPVELALPTTVDFGFLPYVGRGTAGLEGLVIGKME